MITLAVVLASLMVLGVLTHFVPALRRGRTGYPSNRPHRTSGRSAHLKDLPLTRKTFEFALSPRGEAKLVGRDQVCDGV